MLGHTLFYELSRHNCFDVSGTVRNPGRIDKWFNADILPKIVDGVDADNIDDIRKLVFNKKPNVVINCIGIIKQIPLANDPIATISINALFPHQVAKLCGECGARFVHVSTDCVFSGQMGDYSEKDIPDATDLYGKTKFLGEVHYPHSITLRTSIIGHELKGKYGLIEWFLSQKGKVKGYTNAIFSGFPTVELARIICEYVIPNESLSGLYHVSSNSISKFNLLKIVAEQYKKNVKIEPFDKVKENRSLNSEAFRRNTGYNPPPWKNLIEKMHQHYIDCPCYRNI